ncbi:MAG: cell division protein FtsQ/DivIB [Chloroflexia bacterium]
MLPSDAERNRTSRRQIRAQARPGLARALMVWLKDARLFGAFLALVSIAALGYSCLHPRFTVASVEVTGQRALSVDRAIRESAALGKNLFLLDPAEVEARLKTIPYVWRVRVERELPNRVRLVIYERFPGVSWCNSSSTDERYLVDEEGVVLGPEEPGMPEIIYIVNLDPGAAPLAVHGRVDQEAVRTAQQVFSRLFGDLGIALLPFEYEPGRGITAVSADGWRAVFGNAERLDEKVSKLAWLLQSGTSFVEVDLRKPNQIYYY